MSESYTDEQIFEIVNKRVGWSGRMLSGSKRPPITKLGTHLVVWNSNVVVAGIGKVWYGDFDITLSEDVLKGLAQDFGGRTVYILREMDGRFDNETNPKIDRAVYFTNGVTGEIGAEYTRYYHRSEETGRIVETPREK